MFNATFGFRSLTTVGDVERCKTIHNMERSHLVDQKPANLETAFKTTFNEVNQSPDKLLKGGREARVTFQHLARRRSTVLERKASTVARKSVTTAGGSRESSGGAIPYQRPRHGPNSINFANPNKADPAKNVFV